MDFTREPIIETIITPREGYRLVVRSSKSVGQEEHFVDAVEVVSFGSASFFRSLERPKPFVVPIADYEVLEVREPRMVLKTGPVASSVKIAGGREGQPYKPPREREREREREVERKELPVASEPERLPVGEEPASTRLAQDGRGEKRRDRRRGFRRRRGMRDDSLPEDQSSTQSGQQEGQSQEYGDSDMGFSHSEEGSAREQGSFESTGEPTAEPLGQTTLFRSILPPPATLIRDDLQRLRDSEIYRGAFFLREEGSDDRDDDDSSLESVESDREQQGPQLVAENDNEKQEASIQEEPFLFSQAVEGEAQPNTPKDFP